MSQCLTHGALKVETFIERVLVVRLTCARELKPCTCGLVNLSPSLKLVHPLPLLFNMWFRINNIFTYFKKTIRTLLTFTYLKICFSEDNKDSIHINWVSRSHP